MGQGSNFTPARQSFCSPGEGCLPLVQGMSASGPRGATNPTGMLSCLCSVFFYLYQKISKISVSVLPGGGIFSF